MIQKVQNMRNEMKPDYNGFIIVHVKAFTTVQIKLKF